MKSPRIRTTIIVIAVVTGAVELSTTIWGLLTDLPVESVSTPRGMLRWAVYLSTAIAACFAFFDLRNHVSAVKQRPIVRELLGFAILLSGGLVFYFMVRSFSELTGLALLAFWGSMIPLVVFGAIRAAMDEEDYQREPDLFTHADREAARLNHEATIRFAVEEHRKFLEENPDAAREERLPPGAKVRRNF